VASTAVKKSVIVQTSSACRDLLLIQQLNKQQILGMLSLSALLQKNLQVGLVGFSGDPRKTNPCFSDYLQMIF